MDYNVGTFVLDWVAIPTNVKVINEQDKILYEGRSSFIPWGIERMMLLRITVKDNYLLLFVEDFKEEEIEE